MSDKLMDTAPGGQSTQYESIKQFTNPPDKDVGQLGDPNAATKSASTNTDAPSSASASASLNKSASGAGEALGSADDEAEQRARREQGYGGERDMRRDVGA